MCCRDSQRLSLRHGLHVGVDQEEKKKTIVMTAVSQYLSCPWIRTGIVSANMPMVENNDRSFVGIPPSL